MVSPTRDGVQRWFIALLAGLMLLVTGALGQESGAGASASQGESRRARWERMSPAERADLRERFQRLQKMPKDERARLEERAERLAREIAELEASLGEEERALLKAMAPRERADELKRLVAERARQAASRLRSRMTQEERQRLEAATPGERATILRSIRERELARLPERIVALGEDLGLSRQELSRIRQGSPEEQRQAMARLLRRRIERQVGEQGLPADFSGARWARLQRMGDDGFLRALQHIRRRHPEFGVPPKRWEAHLKRSETLAQRLEALGRPDDSERARFPNLPERVLARRALLARRDRLEEVLARHGKMGPETLARLRSLSDQEFLMLHAAAIRVLREGGDLRDGVARWLDRGRGGPGRRGGPPQWQER